MKELFEYPTYGGQVETDVAVAERSSNREELLEQFQEWAAADPDAALSLQVPEEFIELFIPEKAYEVAQEGGYEAFPIAEAEGELHVAAVQRGYRDESSSVSLRPALNRLIEDGYVLPEDRILMDLHLVRDVDHADVAYVAEYDGEPGLGIATELYTITLPEVLRRLGIRYIAGTNTEENKSFFLDKVERVASNHLRPERQQYFFPGISKTSLDSEDSICTVQFLSEADKERETIP